MTTTARIQRVPRPRGELTDEQIEWLRELRRTADAAEAAYRQTVVLMLSKGGSFSEVAKATGLSTNTLQRWKKEAGK